MKARFTPFSLVAVALVMLAGAPSALAEAPATPNQAKIQDRATAEEHHRRGAEELAAHQDHLTADVQQLKIEQTEPEVIELLDGVETVMNEVIDHLEQRNTGGATIATQTEVIEKIFNAAKQHHSQGQGENKGAQGMMEMMKRMMGENAEADEKKRSSGEPSGPQPGNGNNGASASASTPSTANGSSAVEERRVPKASGSNSEDFPEEFRALLDGYNRSLAK